MFKRTLLRIAFLYLKYYRGKIITPNELYVINCRVKI